MMIALIPWFPACPVTFLLLLPHGLEVLPWLYATIFLLPLSLSLVPGFPSPVMLIPM